MIELTWPAALAIMGSLTAVLTFFFKLLKKDEKHPDIVALQTEQAEIRAQLAVLENRQNNADEKHEEVKEKFLHLNEKLEKITDLIIELIKTQNS